MWFRPMLSGPTASKVLTIQRFQCKSQIAKSALEIKWWHSPKMDMTVGDLFLPKCLESALTLGESWILGATKNVERGTTSGTLLLLLLLLIQHSRRQASHQSQFFITNSRHSLSPSTKSFLKIQLDPCATHPYKSQELYWHLLKVWRWKAIPRSTLAPTWVRTCTAMLGFFLQRFVSSFRSSNNSLLVTGPRLLSNRDSKEYMYRRWAS